MTGELGLDAPEVGVDVVEADQLLEVGVHGRDEVDEDTVDPHSSTAGATGRVGGEWAWKDSNLRLAGYEPAVLTS